MSYHVIPWRLEYWKWLPFCTFEKSFQPPSLISRVETTTKRLRRESAGKKEQAGQFAKCRKCKTLNSEHPKERFFKTEERFFSTLTRDFFITEEHFFHCGGEIFEPGGEVAMLAVAREMNIGSTALHCKSTNTNTKYNYVTNTKTNIKDTAVTRQSEITLGSMYCLVFPH